MKEYWKVVPNYPEYKINNYSDVISLKSGRWVAINPTLCGKYFALNLYDQNKKRKKINLHQLMAITFLSHKPNGNKAVVDHIDGNPLNNHISNLQIISNRENLLKGKRKSIIGYAGVQVSGKKWRSSIVINGKFKNLGSFIHPYWAHLAYEQKRRNL